MCISLPAKITAVDGNQALIELEGTSHCVMIAVDDVKVGDWVLVYGGVAIAAIDPAQAAESRYLINQLNHSMTQSGPIKSPPV